MIADVYGGIGTQTTQLSDAIVQQYIDMLDKDKDGKIGLGDIENFVSQYLSDMPSSGIVFVNQSFQPQSGSPQNMRVKTAGLNMSASFMSFE